MDSARLRVGAVAGAALIGALALVVWFRDARVSGIEPRLPGESASVFPADQRPTPKVVERNTGTLIPGPGSPSSIVGSWPQFRGADRTNIAWAETGLARAWPPEGPRVLWRLEVGEGHAGAAIRNGRVYLDDYDRDKKEDAIRCLSLADGSEIWRYTYYVPVKRNHGMSRTVVAVNDDYVVALGPKCHVHCLDARTGELIWKMDLVKEYGSKVPPWYAGQCPLIDGDRVILAPGGDPLMMAVDLASGDILWRTPNPGGWGMTHSSVVALDYRGSRQYVYCTTKGVVSVSAEDGRILWTKPDWKIPLSNVPSPVVVGEDRIFLSGGYEAGCVMIRLTGEGDQMQVEELWRLDYKVFGADQQTPILYQDHIYGVIPGGQLACLDLDGKRVWSSGVTNEFGLGPFLLTDGLLLVLNDQEGTLHLIEASPAGYNDLARAKVLEGHDAWAPMALVGGRLIVRDLTEMVCLEIPKG